MVFAQKMKYRRQLEAQRTRRALEANAKGSGISKSRRGGKDKRRQRERAERDAHAELKRQREALASRRYRARLKERHHAALQAHLERAAAATAASTCGVCLEAVEADGLATLDGCDHIFCLECVSMWCWRYHKSTCPTCRTPSGTIIESLYHCTLYHVQQ